MELRLQFRNGSRRQRSAGTEVNGQLATAARPRLLAESTGNVLCTQTFRCDSAKSYDVFLLEGLFSAGSTLLADIIGSRRGLLVTTPTVAALYGPGLLKQIDRHGLDIAILVLDCTEQNKSLDFISKICSRALELKLDRRGLLIGVGGGVCTDLVTVAASWIRRGIGHVPFPRRSSARSTLASG